MATSSLNKYKFMIFHFCRFQVRLLLGSYWLLLGLLALIGSYWAKIKVSAGDSYWRLWKSVHFLAVSSLSFLPAFLSSQCFHLQSPQHWA